MKIQIELTEEQLNLMINALEVSFRIMMGQGAIVADLISNIPRKADYDDEHSWKRMFDKYIVKRSVAGRLIYTLSSVLYDDCVKIPEDTNRYSDIWSALRHLQYQLHPHDGYDPRKSEPFQVSDYPMMKVELMEEEELSDES